ncbi:MAG: class I SAM-dependent methyltransferase [Chloroflexi bacterium]|nr:class I SAM-dependent methyltransferase [Chloroflexota bacterium]
MRLGGQLKGGYYPTPPRVVDHVRSLLFAPIRYGRNRNDIVRLLDPCCGPGDALRQLADSLNRHVTVETYGVELHAERAQEAAERLDHSLSSDLFRCSIANRTFNLLWLNPPYDWDREDKRVEQAFLTHCSRYLEPDGVLVYIIPLNQVPTSARFLTTNYRRVRAWAFPEPEVEQFDQVVVIGVRKPQPRPDARAMQELIASVDDLAPLGRDLTPEYDVGMSPPGPVMFTTRVIDFSKAVAEAGTRGLWTQDEITEAFWPPTDATARPLMPLRKGHLAMLVAAGFLDNLELETQESRVLVKGQTKKEMVLVEEGETHDVYREQLRTSVVTLDLDSGRIERIEA